MFPSEPRWTSGFDLVSGADLLIHDAQYADHEYADHVGWGHSSIGHAIALADQAGVGHLVAFHHDPAHDDATLDRLYGTVGRPVVSPAREGDRYAVIGAGRSARS